MRKKYRGSRKAEDRRLTAAQRRHSPSVVPSALSIQVDAALAVGSQAPPPADQSATGDVQTDPAEQVATDVQIESAAPGVVQTDPRADDQIRVEGLSDAATRQSVVDYDFEDWQSGSFGSFLV